MNIFQTKKSNKLTIQDKLDRDEARLKEWMEVFLKFKPRIERLDKLYPDTIQYVDMCIMKYITLKDDVEIPEGFLCSCHLLGLKIKDVKNNISYTQNKKFYYSIDFSGVSGDNCDD
jgi:hypothetical protein